MNFYKTHYHLIHGINLQCHKLEYVLWIHLEDDKSAMVNSLTAKQWSQNHNIKSQLNLKISFKLMSSDQTEAANRAET